MARIFKRKSEPANFKPTNLVSSNTIRTESPLLAKAQFDFRGGIELPGFKSLSLGSPESPKLIQTAPIPKRLALPLSQHIGATAEACVNVGDRVLKGQKIAKPDGYISAPIHASSSGTVVAIHEHPVPHPSGLTAACIIIETDGLDESVPVQYVEDYNIMDASHLRNVIRQAGIVGLGGAAFPTNVKMNPGRGKKVNTLILNGAECEPYITCDEALMRERAAHVIAGIDIIQRAVNATDVMIGIGDQMHQEAAALTSALEKSGRTDTKVVMVPTRYPKGGEKQLIQSLTGKEVPSNGLPLDIGVICQNVGTAAAIYRAVCLGEPLVSRIVTVTGPGIASPVNVEARLGTPVRDLVAFAGGYTPEMERLIMGGPMMGYALHSDQVPIVKSTNCILGAGKADLPDASAEMPCIRCGACADVCPASLLPQQLFWHSKAKEFDRTQEYNLFDCIECGCCSAVCPSQIPLVQYYRFAKGEIWKDEAAKTKADKARVRHESRIERFEKQQAEKAARLAAKKAALKNTKKTTDTDSQVGQNGKANKAGQGIKPSSADAASSISGKSKPATNDTIAEAIARAKAKKAASQGASQTASQVASKATAQSNGNNSGNIGSDSGSDENATVSPPTTAASDKPAANLAMAAIERAKQNAAAKKSQSDKAAKSSVTKTDKIDRAAIAAAAIAKAKAKKLAAEKEAQNANADVNADVDVAGKTADNGTDKPALSPAMLAIENAKRKAKEKAKEKSLDQSIDESAAKDADTIGDQQVKASGQISDQPASNPSSEPSGRPPSQPSEKASSSASGSALTPAQAAIARAKAKAAEKQQTSQVQKLQKQKPSSNSKDDA